MQLISTPVFTSENTAPTGYSLTVIVPVFNEQQCLVSFHESLCDAIAKMRGERVQILYINDGSTDQSWQLIKRLSSPFADIERINLSRNFGKEAAMTAGLDHALGDAVTILDADLQDPPELLVSMLAELRKGYDIVNMQRRKRLGESWFKKSCATLYYRLFRWLSDTPVQTEVGDFRLLSKRVVEHIKRLPERSRYLKGIMSWPGFPQTTLQFDRPQRQAGTTKWSFLQLCGLALSGITAFSVKPLRLATIAGALVSSSAFLYAVWVFSKTVLFGEPVAGYPSLILVVLFLGGAQLLGIGIVGEYLGRIFIESKARPIYLVMEKVSSSAVASEGARQYG